MLSTACTAQETETMADLLDRLGGVSPSRIRMCPYPGTATVRNVVSIEEHEDRLFELVDGVLVEKITGYLESQIASLLITALQNFVAKNDLGVVTGADGMIRLPENLVRMPDVAFARWDCFPDGEIPAEAAPEIAPDLAVEVLSPGNTAREMSRKLREYFSAGVRLVWFVDPKSKVVTVYTSPSRSKVIPVSGTLDGGKVLPGFELPVASLFAKPKRSKKNRNGN